MQKNQVSELRPQAEQFLRDNDTLSLEQFDALPPEVKRRMLRDLQGDQIVLKKIARCLPGVIYQYRLRPDGSSAFPFASEAIRDIYRVSPEEVSEDASRVFAALHPEDYDDTVASIRASARDLTLWHHEYRVQFDDGTVRWLSGNAAPQREADGSTLWHGFITDVSKSRAAERSLRDSEQQLRLALQGGSLGIWDFNAVTGQVAVNERWLSMLGLEPNGDPPTINSWHALVHPEDMPKLERLLHEVFFNPSGIDFEVEVRARHRDGHFIWILDKGAVVDRAADGSPLRVVGTHMDITERKLAEEAVRAKEEHLRFLLSSTPAVIYTCHASGDFAATFVSENVQEQLGYLASEFTEDPFFWANHIHPDDVERVFAGIRPALAEDSHEHEYRFLYYRHVISSKFSVISVSSSA